MKRRKKDDMQRAYDSLLKSHLANSQKMQRAQLGHAKWKQQDYADAVPPQPPEPPPVFSECVIGYRVWTLDALGRLRPQSVNHSPWTPGENTAVCEAHRTGMFGASFSWYLYGTHSDPQAPRDHKAPAVGCDCGLYARFNPEDLQVPEYDLNSATWFVCGAIAGWGDVQVHRDGMRAEKACIVALALTDNMPPEIRALVERVAEAYGVPAVPFAALADEGLLHGTPLPEEAKPPVPKPSKSDWYTQQLYSQIVFGKQAYRPVWGAGRLGA